MSRNVYFLFFFLILCLFKISFATKKIMILEGDNLDVAIKNSYENKYKLFLIFYVKNCSYCTQALRVLKNKVVKNFEEEDEIYFGSVDLDNQLNVWVGLRFNITKIPFIILIENNRLYHFENQIEESLVLKFINEEKYIEDGKEIPGPVTFMVKFDMAVKEVTEKIQELIDYLGIKIKWSDKMTYAILIIIVVFLIYLEHKLINRCGHFDNYDKKKNNLQNIKQKDNQEAKTEEKINENEKDKKPKKE